jgi:hypothetical protein
MALGEQIAPARNSADRLCQQELDVIAAAVRVRQAARLPREEC